MAHNTNTHPHSVLNDPNVHTVPLSVAAALAGVAKSTATAAAKNTGRLVDGVPVYRIGRRCVVVAHDLREFLRIPHPVQNVTNSDTE